MNYEMKRVWISGCGCLNSNLDDKIVLGLSKYDWLNKTISIS